MSFHFFLSSSCCIVFKYLSHIFAFFSRRYDDNKEIIGGATHKSARLVVWQSDIYRLNRPPAVQFLQGQVLFHVVYSKDKSKMEQAFVEYKDFREVPINSGFCSLGFYEIMFWNRVFLNHSLLEKLIVCLTCLETCVLETCRGTLQMEHARLPLSRG